MHITEQQTFSKKWNSLVFLKFMANSNSIIISYKELKNKQNPQYDNRLEYI